MPIIEFHVSLFDEAHGGLPAQDSRDCVLWLMEALVRCNEKLLRRYPDIPFLYEAPVRYAQEPIEQWRDIRHVIAAGEGDCEDLACWRAAELRVRAGIRAGPYIKWRQLANGNWRYHALVERPDGRIEDPSIALGMHGEMLRKPVFVAP